MRKPEFEHLRHTVLARSKPIPQKDREPYRESLVTLLEDTGLFLVQKARKDGHDDALIEVHASWIGTDFSTEAVVDALKSNWSAKAFDGGEVKHWIDVEDEVVTLEYVWSGSGAGFLTGRVKVTLG